MRMINDRTLLDKILKAKKVPFEYYTYPTYSAGVTIAEDEANVINDLLIPESENSEVVNAVDMMINEAVALLDTRRDNKTAVACRVEGVEFPVYFLTFDNQRAITTGVRQKDGRSPIEIKIN